MSKTLRLQKLNGEILTICMFTTLSEFSQNELRLFPCVAYSSNDRMRSYVSTARSVLHTHTYSETSKPQTLLDLNLFLCQNHRLFYKNLPKWRVAIAALFSHYEMIDV